MSIVAEIIRSTVGTALVIGKNVVLLFQIIAYNAGSASPLALAAASAIFAVILFALLKFFRSEAKILLIAVVILAGLMLAAMI